MKQWRRWGRAATAWVWEASLLAAVAALTAATWAYAAPPAADTARYLAGTCANCHGTRGAAQGGMPSLAGLDAAYLAGEMRRFRDGQRPATAMQQIAKGMSDAQVEAIARHFAREPRAQER